jgi:hypothetical protein
VVLRRWLERNVSQALGLGLGLGHGSNRMWMAGERHRSPVISVSVSPAVRSGVLPFLRGASGHISR